MARHLQRWEIRNKQTIANPVETHKWQWRQRLGRLALVNIPRDISESAPQPAAVWQEPMYGRRSGCGNRMGEAETSYWVGRR